MNNLKELPSLENVDFDKDLQTEDRKKKEWKTFAGQKALFPVGEEFTLAYDSERPIFGEKNDDGDFRHVRLTALGKGHDLVSIPLSYFTRPVFTKDKSLAVFSKKEGKAYLLGGQIIHNLSIPGGLDEEGLIKHLHGTKVIVKQGNDDINYLALPFNTNHDDDVENLRNKLVPKNTFKLELAR